MAVATWRVTSTAAVKCRGRRCQVLGQGTKGTCGIAGLSGDHWRDASSQEGIVAGRESWGDRGLQASKVPRPSVLPSPAPHTSRRSCCAGKMRDTEFCPIPTLSSGHQAPAPPPPLPLTDPKFPLLTPVLSPAVTSPSNARVSLCLPGCFASSLWCTPAQ